MLMLGPWGLGIGVDRDYSQPRSDFRIDGPNCLGFLQELHEKVAPSPQPRLVGRRAKRHILGGALVYSPQLGALQARVPLHELLAQPRRQ